MLARRLIMAGGAGGAIPSYTGSHAIFGDAKQGYIECYGSGTITFPKEIVVDVFVLPSGLKGSPDPIGSASDSYEQAYGGAGGRGGKGETAKGVSVIGDYTITIGATCSSATKVNSSSALGTTASTALSYSGGSRGFAYNDIEIDAFNNVDSSNEQTTKPGAGRNGTSYPFGETSGAFYKQLGATGGGGAASTGAVPDTMSGAKGGTLGGGLGQQASHNFCGNGADGAANTGSGGGGGSAYGYWNVWESNTSKRDYSQEGANGKGGSGIVIIRWGYAA